MGNAPFCGGLCDVDNPVSNPAQLDLSHYKLLKVVGRGGFGKVNAVMNKSTRKLHALKRMAKCEIIKKESHIRMIWIERNIMSKFNCQFLCHLEHAFQNDTELFFVMPFMQGGDLRYHLGQRGMLKESEVKFYAAEIICGLEHMHSLKIVYRDLKPDNMMLDVQGHLRLSDFGLSRQLESAENYQMRGSAGTAGYLAPEVVNGEFYSVEIDFWSLGVTIYELLHSIRPYRSWRPDKDVISRLKYNAALSSDCRRFIKSLLQIDPRERLGCGGDGVVELMNHPWMRDIDWNKARTRSLPPPIIPNPSHANCNNQADLADQLIDQKPTPIPEAYQRYFRGFEWNTSLASAVSPLPAVSSTSPVNTINTVETSFLNSNGGPMPLLPLSRTESAAISDEAKQSQAQSQPHTRTGSSSSHPNSIPTAIITSTRTRTNTNTKTNMNLSSRSTVNPVSPLSSVTAIYNRNQVIRLSPSSEARNFDAPNAKDLDGPVDNDYQSPPRSLPPVRQPQTKFRLFNSPSNNLRRIQVAEKPLDKTLTVRQES